MLLASEHDCNDHRSSVHRPQGPPSNNFSSFNRVSHSFILLGVCSQRPWRTAGLSCPTFTKQPRALLGQACLSSVLKSGSTQDIEKKWLRLEEHSPCFFHAGNPHLSGRMVTRQTFCGSPWLWFATQKRESQLSGFHAVYLCSNSNGTKPL